MLRFLSVSALSLSLLGPLAAQSTVRVSLSDAGTQGSGASAEAQVSGDGRFVVFHSQAPDLVPGDVNGQYDVFVRDLVLGHTLRASVDSAGNGAALASIEGQISDDGTRVVFLSIANNLVANDTNNSWDVFLHDFTTGQTSRLSLTSAGAQLPRDSRAPAISADGRFAAFETDAVVLPGDGNGNYDVFVVEIATGVVRCASVDSTGLISSAGLSEWSWLSGDGRYAVFESDSAQLVPGDTNGAVDVFVHDFQTGTTQRVDLDSLGGQCPGAGRPRISADGRFVSFLTDAALVPGDTNGVMDVYLRDLLLGTTERVSIGSAGQQANGFSFDNMLSADGRYVVFESSATNLVAGDTNSFQDVFVRDRQAGTTVRASLSAAGLQVNDDSYLPSISNDGRLVVFHSAAGGLVVPDLTLGSDVYARFLSNPSEAFCFGDGSQLTACPCSNFGFPGNGCENSFGTGGANLAATGITLPDTLVLSSTGELPSSLSIFLQGNAELNPGALFGDGVRCVGGSLRRLYSKNAVNSSVSAPGAGDPGIRARSAQLGDVIPVGSTRSYQVYYRDPSASFCPAPQGNTWNVTNGVRVRW